MRKLIIGLGIGVAAIIVIAAAALFLVDVNRYRGAVQAQLERQLGRSVTLGHDPVEFEPTSIGHGVYIGPNSVIAKGVTIGDSAVIGALERRKYRPATSQGKPVDVFYTFTLRLKLPQ